MPTRKSRRRTAVSGADGCMMILMALPLDAKRFRAYEIEFGAGGQRLGCKFLLDDGSLLFIHETQITPEIESLMASLGSPTKGLTHGGPNIESGHSQIT